MASNPTIDAVPHHLRDTSNPTAQIQRYLAGQRPFLQEFIVRGREHIDRALKRDERRAELKLQRERQGGGIGEGSSSWEGSTVTGLASSSSRSSGIVKRMRRKDGSCLQETGKGGNDLNRKDLDGGKNEEALQGTDTIVVDVLKRSEFRARKRQSGVRRELEDIHEETDRDKENVDQYLDAEAGKKPPANALAGTATVEVKDKQPSKLKPSARDDDKEKKKFKGPENEMITDLPVRSRARPVLVDKILNVKEDKQKDTTALGGKKRKKGWEELDRDVGKDANVDMNVDGASMTSSAKRRHERKLRRRAKAAIRHTPSRPPDDQIAMDVEDGEDEEEVGSTIEVLPATSTSKRPTTTSTNKDAGKAKNGNDRATITKPATATPATTTMSTTIRKRKGNVGLNMMANFKSDSLAKGRRMTLTGSRTGMFLGGRKVSSTWRNVAGEGRGAEAGDEMGVGVGSRQREPSSSPPSKIRRVEVSKAAASKTRPALGVIKAVGTAADDGVRRSKRLSEKNESPGSVDREESESEASSASSSSSGTKSRSRSSYSRKLAAGRRREDKPTSEPEREREVDLEWSVSSPGRGRNVSKAKALVDRETISSQREAGTMATGIEIGVEAEMGHPGAPRSTITTGREAGPSFGLRSRTRSKLGSSFHVRTDTPLSKQSRSQYRLPAQYADSDRKDQKELNHTDDAIGKGFSSLDTDKENEHRQTVGEAGAQGVLEGRRALKSIRLAGSNRDGNPREKNWFRPPKSRKQQTGMQDDVDEPDRPALGLGRQGIQDMAIGAEDDEPAEDFIWGTNVFRQDGTDMGMGTMIGGWAYELGEDIEDGMEGWQEVNKGNVDIDLGIGGAYGRRGYSVGMNGDFQEYEDGDEDEDRVGMDMGMRVGLHGAYGEYGLEGLDLDLDMGMGQDENLYPFGHLSEGLQPYHCCDNDNVEEEDQDGHELQVNRPEGDGRYEYDDRHEARCFDPMALEMDSTCDVQLDTDLNLETEMQTMDTEDEPAIDMFGTRVSELQREIFAGGRGRW